MKSEIIIDNRADVSLIEIEGTIGIPEQWQFEEPAERVATYDKFRDALRRIAQIEAPHIIVEIRSTGGDVNDALLIHDALKGLGGRVTTRCYGYTASAATIIAQAASDGAREISANALYLIHNAACATEGNAAELGSKVELLHQTDARIADVYAARAGRPAAEYAALMGENNGTGRWLSPVEAIEAGLADVVIEPAWQAGQPTPATSNRIVRGWQRLLARMGLHGENIEAGQMSPASTSLPEDRNNLHFDEERQALLRRSAIALEEGQRSAVATTTKPREDPSCHDALRTANELSYSEDALRMRKL